MDGKGLQKVLHVEQVAKLREEELFVTVLGGAGRLLALDERVDGHGRRAVRLGTEKCIFHQKDKRESALCSGQSTSIAGERRASRGGVIVNAV